MEGLNIDIQILQSDNEISKVIKNLLEVIKNQSIKLDGGGSKTKKQYSNIIKRYEGGEGTISCKQVEVIKQHLDSEIREEIIFIQKLIKERIFNENKSITEEFLRENPDYGEEKEEVINYKEIERKKIEETLNAIKIAKKNTEKRKKK